LPERSHLRRLQDLCLAADIAERDADREALGWAIARLMELESVAIATARGEVQREPDRSEEHRLSDLVDFICKRTRSDRRRAEREFQREREANG
jgi:hypothetical protein